MSSENGHHDSFVLFELAGATYAIRSSSVQQLEMIEHITPVPNADNSVAGVVFSRGQVIPAVSLRRRFGFPEIEHDIRSRLIVVRTDGRSIGLIVDAAREFKRIPEESIDPPADTLGGTSGNYLEGIATTDDRMILILKLEELIRTTAEIENEIKTEVTR
jgi:purine-binding chemotaxis protein CheW